MKKWFCIVFVLFLTGCSSQFVYNNMDWMIHWYLDDYIDLDKPQKTLFDEQFLVWHKWHRQEELVKYVEQINEIRTMIEQDSVTEEAMQNHFDRIRLHWVSLRNRIAPDLVKLAPVLTPKQSESLFKYLAKQNDEDQEELDELYELTDEERLEKRKESLQKNLKEWLGKLTKPQKQLVSDYAPQFRSNGREWLKYRRAVQSMAKVLFEQKENDPEFSSKLMQIMTNPESYRHPTLVNNSEYNGNIYNKMVVDLAQKLTAKQKKRLLRKLDNYIEDFQDLSED